MIRLPLATLLLMTVSCLSLAARADEPPPPAAAESIDITREIAAEVRAQADNDKPDATSIAILVDVRAKLAAWPQPEGDKERADLTALSAMYTNRTDGPLWVTASALTPVGRKLADELANAAAYGLDGKDFQIAALAAADSATLTAEAAADLELRLSIAALKYARYARGGRIPAPAEQLNSNLDRRPQWVEPTVILERLTASNSDPAAVLRDLHPKHPQFERLRQQYAALLPKAGQPLSAAAKRLRANMEMWRWMNDDMGELHVLNNIPEFMQRVYRNGEVIRSERIVAGMLDKQSSIFSRPLKYVVLRPQWRVPESIKVKELWPSLIRGGGYMRQYGLEMQTKQGQPVDWRRMDWVKSDIRNYEVVQPPGPKSVLGVVKFTFPSQHTIFMHDTPDKWMFRSAQRTLSHGCLRVWKPMDLAELVLDYDKGWDKAKIAELNRSGPLNNEVTLDKRVPIHLVYFTAWVGDDGRTKIFGDVYGHEKRVTQALDGDWHKINKGRDHLAPVQPINTSAVAARATQQVNRALPRSAQKDASIGDILQSAFGIGD